MQTKKKSQHIITLLCSSWECLQVFNQLLLLLEDVLQLSKGGLHLFQRELVLTLCSLIFGYPGVQLSDSSVQQSPFLDEGVHLTGPLVCTGLHLDIPGLESLNLCVGILVSRHLLCRSISGLQDFEVVKAGLLHT